jgi:hypothetical protein
MCKPGEPCNEQDKDSNTQAMFARIETLIVMTELYEAQKVDLPAAAVSLIDVVGPLLMDSIKKAKGWDNLTLAMAIIKQKHALFASHGMAPPSSGMEVFIEMLSEIMGSVKKDAKA